MSLRFNEVNKNLTNDVVDDSENVYTGLNRLNVKGKLKDSVFTTFFKDTENVAELCKALHFSNKDIKAEDIDILTCQPVFINHMYNDLSFVAKGEFIVLVEAQTKWSKNIILRIMLYYLQALEKYVSMNDLDLHSNKVLNVPRPKLYVIYTGNEPSYRDVREISFADFYFDGVCDVNAKATVLHEGEGNDVVHQYVRFTQICDEVRKEFNGMSDKAVEEIIKRCINEGVLKDFMIHHRQEVENIMMEELTIEQALAITARNSIEEGIEKGREEGKQEFINDVISKKLAKGISINNIAKELEMSTDEVQATIVKYNLR